MRNKCTGHLVKTNPIKANFNTEDGEQKTDVREQSTDYGSLPAGGGTEDR